MEGFSKSGCIYLKTQMLLYNTRVVSYQSFTSAWSDQCGGGGGGEGGGRGRGGEMDGLIICVQ